MQNEPTLWLALISPIGVEPAVTDSKRFTGGIGGMRSQDVDLLECLLRIDRGQVLDVLAADFLERLIKAGLVDRKDQDPSLTLAGVERCQSLQHRVASDNEAIKVLAARGLPLKQPE